MHPSPLKDPRVFNSRVLQKSPHPLLTRFIWLLWLTLIAAGFSATASAAEHPLPSWNKGSAKKAIMEFVETTTRKDSPHFIPVNERIATFDNDGTLWSEKPIYFQILFVMDRIKIMAPDHPEWKTEEPFASVLKDDPKAALAGGKEALGKLLAATHSGVSSEKFREVVSYWLATARHPTTDKPYDQMVFQPMLELLQYLRDNQFKTFIVSGGGIDFMRAFTEKTYGIPPEQVVGSSLKARYEVKDNVPMIIKLPELNFYDDKEDKPIGIYQNIGRRPVFAAGNSDGDYQMLEWTTTGEGTRFGLLVHHTDDKREWAYDRDSSVGQLNKGLDDAPANGWLLVDMKKDWKVIYPFEKH